MRVAMDMMPGNAAPESLAAAAWQAIRADGKLHVTLVGRQDRIDAALDSVAASRKRIRILHCTQTLADSNAADDLRYQPDCSIARCWQLLAERKVEAIIGTGGAKAVTEAGLRYRRFLPRIRMPGLACLWQQKDRQTVVIDCGAQEDGRPDRMYQHGVMGAAVLKHCFRVKEPTIQLLAPLDDSPGQASLIAEAERLFLESPWRDRFLGVLERDQWWVRPPDVTVCDGRTGSRLLAELLASDSRLAWGAVLGIDGIALWCPVREEGDPSRLVETFAVATGMYNNGINQVIRDELAGGPLRDLTASR